MLFHGATEKGVLRKLKGADQVKLSTALERRGLGHLSHEKIAEALSGKNKAGLRQGELKGIVEALQHAGAAPSARTASQMVLQASRDAQLEANPGLTKQAIKARLKNIAREQREEANAEEASKDSMGVLDRMRGDLGRANKSEAPFVEETKAEGEQTIRQLRDSWRKSIELQPKIPMPKKPENGGESGSGFQA